MFKDENKASSLAQFLSKFDYAFVDTCSLMENSFPEWMDILVNAKEYLPESLHIVVLHKCVEELKNHAKDRKNNTKRIIAKRALKILRLVKWKKILELPRKNRNQNLADNVIYTEVSRLRITNKCLVITQDKKLAYDVRGMNHLSSQKGKFIDVYKLVDGGALVVNYGEPGEISKEERLPYQKRETKRPLFKKPTKPQSKQNAPKQVAKPSEVVLNDLQKQAVNADFALNSKIHNPNYAKEKKLADIRAQQELLAKIGDLKPLNLLLSPEKLVQEASALEGANKPKAVKPVEKPAKEEKAKPVEKKIEEKPVAPKKLWYEYGANIPEALTRVLGHYSIMVRDDSIAYVAQIHGKVNFTKSDLDTVSAELAKNINGYVYKQMKFIAEKTDKGYKAMIDFDLPVEAKKETKKAPKAKKVEEAKETKPLEPKKEKAKPAEKPVKAEPKKAKAKKEKAVEPAPVKATLVVAAPEEGEMGKAKKTKAAAKKEKVEIPVKETPKAKPAKAEKTKKAEKEAKKEEPKKAKAKADKPVEVAPKAQPKKEAKKKDAKEPAKSPLDEALASEKVFMANINNPNYPVEKKKASLEKQIELSTRVDPKDRDKLSYSLDSLKAMLALLK